MASQVTNLGLHHCGRCYRCCGLVWLRPFMVALLGRFLGIWSRGLRNGWVGLAFRRFSFEWVWVDRRSRRLRRPWWIRAICGIIRGNFRRLKFTLGVFFVILGSILPKSQALPSKSLTRLLAKLLWLWCWLCLIRQISFRCLRTI